MPQTMTVPNNEEQATENSTAISIEETTPGKEARRRWCLPSNLSHKFPRKPRMNSRMAVAF
jgi:hypothetical protein